MTTLEDDTANEVHALLGEYERFLSRKAEGTTDAYLRTARQMTEWIAQQPGNEGYFQPPQLTKMAVELYLTHLEQEGLSINHRVRVKSTISNFAQFLIEEKGLLQRNPTRGINLLPVQLPKSDHLSVDQRSIMHSLIKQEDGRRGATLFALGYWAGCRVSDLSWLEVVHTHVDARVGWLHLGKKGKGRDIDLINEARQPLYEYLQTTHDIERPYVFISQRSERLTEEGIYYWFRALKAQATGKQWALIENLTFHDLQHDFACRVREAGWSPEEVTYYLGIATKGGVLALQTSVDSTQVAQVSREQVKQKFKYVKG